MNSRIDNWVKISVIVQAGVMFFIGIFTFLQYSLNKSIEEKLILEKSFQIKREAARLIFDADDRQFNEAQLRNILDWIQEEPK